MGIPTEDDWRSEPLCLDGEWAYKNFAGRTADEAVRLFEENAPHYQEDLLYMPSRVFGYYVRAFLKYLESDPARIQPDAASRFVGLIELLASSEPDRLRPIWGEVEPVLRRVVERQDEYDADWCVYGSFRTRARDIARRGFAVTFDVDAPEAVPEDVTAADVRTPRPLTLATVLRLLENEGVEDLISISTRADIVGALGPPDAAGGGDFSFGRVRDWIRYDRGIYSLRFEFEGDTVAASMILPRREQP